MKDRYFLIGTDKNCTPLPRMLNLRANIREEYLNEKLSYMQKKISLVKVEHSFSGNTIYPDILDRGIFILSAFASEVLKLYEPSIKTKKVCLVEEKTYIIYEYEIPILKEIDCLSEKTLYKRGKAIDRGILVADMIPDLALFRLPDIDGCCTVARLDFVESLLKRGAKGVYLQNLEVL